MISVEGSEDELPESEDEVELEAETDLVKEGSRRGSNLSMEEMRAVRLLVRAMQSE